MIDGYNNYAATAWERTVTTTLPQHLRDVEKAVLRNYQIGALIQSQGRVLYNQAGEGLDWEVQYKLHKMSGDLGEGPRQIQRTPQWKKAKLDYRGYNVTDAMSRREFLSNRGDVAIVKIYDGMIDRLKESLSQLTGPQYYVDGYAVGNETNWHGLLSMFGYSGSVDVTAGATLNTQRAANAADRLAWANGAYAGITQSLGAYTGSNSGTDQWPNGTADAQYDFWTPLIVNYNSTAFTPATHTWNVQGVEVLRYALTHSSRNAGQDKQVTNVLMSRDMWLPFLAVYEAIQRIPVSQDLPLRNLGFKDVIMFDGREVSSEIACPVGNAFGINPSNIELRCMTDQLFTPEMMPYNPLTQEYPFIVSHLGNLKMPAPSRSFRLTNVTGNTPS